MDSEVPPADASAPAVRPACEGSSAFELVLENDVTNSPAFRTFSEFYPFYLSEHANRTSRRLHFTGTSLAVLLLGAAFVTRNGWLVLAALLEGYALAWVGHFFFEHNRPATFKHPWLSLRGDWRLWWDILRGRIPL